jgi:hypothetical protein
MTCPRSRTDYRGLHVAAAHIQAEPLEWELPIPRVHRVRVRAHTCVCQSPIFELCTAGGLWFVRRITAESPAVIEESVWRRREPVVANPARQGALTQRSGPVLDEGPSHLPGYLSGRDHTGVNAAREQAVGRAAEIGQRFIPRPQTLGRPSGRRPGDTLVGLQVSRRDQRLAIIARRNPAHRGRLSRAVERQPERSEVL